MEFGMWMPARVDAAGVVATAERVGFRYAHLYDSQMVYADTVACLALCAQQTHSIMLGHGVTNPAVRIAPLLASSLATINQLAPGRAFLGIGSGYSSLAAMGLPPASIADLDEYLRVLRALVDGEVVDYRLNATSPALPIQMIVEDAPDGEPFFNLADRIPFYVAAAGPRALALAGERADGLIIGAIKPDAADVARIRRAMQIGADRVGRRAEDIPIMLMANLYLTEPGERFGNDRMKQAVLGVEQGGIGCFAAGFQPGIAPATGLAGLKRVTDAEIPAPYREAALAYRRLDPRSGADGSLNGRAWWVSAYDGHGWRLRSELLAHVPDDLLRTSAVIGSPTEVMAQIREWESIGISAVGPMLQHNTALASEVVERFGDQVIARY